MDDSHYSASEQDSSSEPPVLPDGWRSAEEVAAWNDVRLAARKRSRLLTLAFVSLILAGVIGFQVWTAAAHYSRGVHALKDHAYGRAVSEFSQARLLFFPYRDAELQEAQARRSLADETFRELRWATVLDELEKASARLEAGDAEGVVTALKAIDAVDLQAALNENAPIRQSADALAKGLAAAARGALRNEAWSSAKRFATALLILEPSSKLAVTFATQAQAGQDRSITPTPSASTPRPSTTSQPPPP